MITALCVIFITSSVMAIRLFAQSQKEQKAFEELVSFVEERNSQNNTYKPTLSQKNGSAETDYISPYAYLKEQNEDFFGWISIEGTQINYPVVYTPSDPEYYLRRDFDGNDSRSGVPFLDGSFLPEGVFYLIHGHNMQNGTMFSQLLSYRDQDFWEAHPNIQFDTLTQTGSFAVMAAFVVQLSAEPEDEFSYYTYQDLRNQEIFERFMQHVQSDALYDTGVEAVYGGRVLMLSTCCDNEEDERFVVIAQEVQ